ncbi:uncharacterized protein LOC117648577 [Thrips palmi]|uniref:Uncharacterized protein LOC117648577 n=1 Tax=Thrips palmi TaxID=161013 RepID=A0A6P8ZR58_THRPL|nr:uncharacterized protein LOC117648577 [Thrips palmi]
MEPQLAVDLITRNASMAEAGVVVGTLIGDDDSSSIQSVRRESDIPVEKWSDLNHIKKAFSTALFNQHVPDKTRVALCVAFSYAITQNQWNPEGVRAALLNIECHFYGEHDGCGEWCKYNEDPVNYKHKGLPYGKPLSCVEFRPKLAALLGRFAANAEKIAPCASSQANENFNNIVATKNPKFKHNCSSEAFPFRLAGAVCQKNIGKQYVMSVYRKLGLSPGELTEKFRLRSDVKRLARSARQSTKEYKTRRLFWGKNKRRKATAQENREGVTYSSGCELNGIADLADDPNVMNRPDISENACPVFFDLETTGLNTLTCEILQIAARSGEKDYSAYILPQKAIPSKVTTITGLQSHGLEMYYHDEKVDTVPLRVAMSGFVSFLKEQGASVILIAHNALRFDALIILRVMRELKIMDEFLDVCGGFVDTLHLFPEKVPGLKSYQQTSVAAQFNISTTNAHNALGDVVVLQAIVDRIGVSRFDLVRHLKTAGSIVEGVQQTAKRKMNEQSLTCLKPAVSAHMVKKIATAGITLGMLQETFVKGGSDAVAFLLSQDVGGAPKVTKQKTKLMAVAQAVEKTL